MSVAAKESKAPDECPLGESMRWPHASTPRRARSSISRWLIATGEDLRFPQVEGARPAGFSLVRPCYLRSACTRSRPRILSVCRKVLLTCLSPAGGAAFLDDAGGCLAGVCAEGAAQQRERRGALRRPRRRIGCSQRSGVILARRRAIGHRPQSTRRVGARQGVQHRRRFIAQTVGEGDIHQVPRGEGARTPVEGVSRLSRRPKTDPGRRRVRPAYGRERDVWSRPT